MTSVDVADQIPAHLNCVGEGWHPLLMRLHEQLLPLCPEYVVMQVKEKFGTLRVYLTGLPMEAHELVDQAEDESMSVCEFCGKSGKPRPGSWVKTMCDGCAA